MPGNHEVLETLFRTRGIHLERGRLFDQAVAPKNKKFSFDKVEGMLLGVAVGDALGVPTEGYTARARRARYGEIRDYLPHPWFKDTRGYPSDDTQLTFWTLSQLIRDLGFVPEAVARRFTTGRIYGIGQTVSDFLENLAAGIPWLQAGPSSAGNGALMRISPMLIPHLRTGGTGIWVDTALSAMMTHNDPASTSACLAFMALLWDLLDMKKAPHPDWWVDRYVDAARDLEGETGYVPRGGAFSDYRGPVWRFVLEKVPAAHKKGARVVDACDAWYSGAYLLETVPSVLMILSTHGSDPEEAVLRAVNDTHDNDTIAAIIGAAMGALHGKKWIPKKWLDGLTGRTAERDDGRVFKWIQDARQAFWESEPPAGSA
jgi:ADP-ribosylglycohydrolase